MSKLARDKANCKSKYWRNKCDDEITRLFRGSSCAVCGTTVNTCAHHLVNKARCAIHRHNFDNLISLCPKHHTMGNEIAPHSTNAFAVRRFTDYLAEHYPHIHEWYEAHQFDKGSSDYRASYEYLKELQEIP